MPSKMVSHNIKDILVGLFEGTGEIVASTIEITRETTAYTLRGLRGRRGEASRVAGQAVAGAIRAGGEAGSDLGSVAKSAIIGTTQGVGEVTKVTASVLYEAARVAVKVTSDVGGDVAVVARKAVEGAIEAGRQAGLKTEDAAAASAAGAMEAARGLGGTVTNTVVKALSGNISGIRVVVETPLKKPLILAVDTDRSSLELLSSCLGREGYDTLSATSLSEFDQIIGEEERITLALVHLSGFDQSIWERCDQLKKAKIPFLVICPQRSPTVQQESLKHGAGGVLIGPIGVKELAEHARCMLGG
jgi:CheY-like chemotaxis protein